MSAVALAGARAGHPARLSLVADGRASRADRDVPAVLEELETLGKLGRDVVLRREENSEDATCEGRGLGARSAKRCRGERGRGSRSTGR